MPPPPWDKATTPLRLPCAGAHWRTTLAESADMLVIGRNHRRNPPLWERAEGARDTEMATAEPADGALLGREEGVAGRGDGLFWSVEGQRARPSLPPPAQGPRRARLGCPPVTAFRAPPELVGGPSLPFARPARRGRDRSGLVVQHDAGSSQCPRRGVVVRRAGPRAGRLVPGARPRPPPVPPVPPAGRRDPARGLPRPPDRDFHAGSRGQGPGGHPGGPGERARAPLPL